MDLLHRYLNAVAIRLPERQRDDIIAELREELLSRVEDEQTRLRRMLTTTDVAALLKTYGHPFIVASRYHPRQFIVGLALYPFYVLGLQIALGAAILTHAFSAVLAIVLGEDTGAVLNWLSGSLWIVAMYLVGLVTFSFWALDRLGLGRWIAKMWSPRLLPSASIVSASRRARSIFEIVFMVILAVWAVSAVYWPGLASRLSLDANVHYLPGWQAFGIQLFAAFALQLAANAGAYVNALGERALRASRITAKVSVLVIVALFFRARPWFDIVGLPAELAQRTAWSLHFAIGCSFAVLASLAIVGVLLDANRLIRGRPASELHAERRLERA